MNITQGKQKKSRLKLMHQYYGYTGFYSFLGSSMLKAIPLILLFIGGILAIHFFVIDVNTLLNIITDTFPTLGVLGVFLISESILGLIPPELFIEAYNKAKSSGLRLVAHAGETAGAESVWGALKTLGAERIGHGVRSVEDPKLIHYLVTNKIPLEVSPTSNYALGILKNGDLHPIRMLLNAGVCCTINSDDPAMFSTSLVQEYFLLLKQGFNCQELYQLNLNALDVSFACDETKAKIKTQLKNYMENRIHFEANA